MSGNDKKKLSADTPHESSVFSVWEEIGMAVTIFGIGGMLYGLFSAHGGFVAHLQGAAGYGILGAIGGLLVMFGIIN